jgi:hypothetical protein
MNMRWAIFLLCLCAGCAHTPAPMTIPDYEPKGPVASIDAQPHIVAQLEPELVEYPGLGVHLVANVAEETYCYHERFYCFFGGRWFRAEAIAGPWNALSMKYVPIAIYRVRGHLPPSLEAEAREENRSARISLVSFQLVNPAPAGDPPDLVETK